MENVQVYMKENLEPIRACRMVELRSLLTAEDQKRIREKRFYWIGVKILGQTYFASLVEKTEGQAESEETPQDQNLEDLRVFTLVPEDTQINRDAQNRIIGLPLVQGG